jgi:hypothetical protein
MGRVEEANVAIGIKILLSDLLPQITAANFEAVRTMLTSGFIEDRNDVYNEVFGDIISRMSYEYKEAFTFLLMECEEKNLLNEYLLVPIKNILSTERWGYNREGINGISREMDFDWLIEQPDFLQRTQIVFLLWQSAG